MTEHNDRSTGSATETGARRRVARPLLLGGILALAVAGGTAGVVHAGAGAPPTPPGSAAVVPSVSDDAGVPPAPPGAEQGGAPKKADHVAHPPKPGR